MSNAKKRKPNFSAREKEILVEEYIRRKDIIRGKFSAILTNKHKQEAWAAITDVLNAAEGMSRDIDSVKKKWDNLLTEAKKEVADYKRELTKTGGGPPPHEPDPLYMKIAESYGEESPTFHGLRGVQSGGNIPLLDDYDETMIDDENDKMQRSDGSDQSQCIEFFPAVLAKSTSRSSSPVTVSASGVCLPTLRRVSPSPLTSNTTTDTVHGQGGGGRKRSRDSVISDLHMEVLQAEKEKNELETKKLHLEIEKLQLEIEKLKLETEKLKLEKAKLEREWNPNTFTAFNYDP